jgi:O-acetyl-ADP-ribose deacetylase
MHKRIKIIQGDITLQHTDAIVNAANNSLLGGGGVDGAIHMAAGPDLLAECRKLKGCNTGEAKITKGYRLPAKYVIHTVGPVWYGGSRNEKELLAGCYRNSLKLASEYGLKSIAFPSISTGAYRFPIEIASEIALQKISDFLQSNETIEKVIIVCFSKDDFEIYRKKLAELPG